MLGLIKEEIVNEKDILPMFFSITSCAVKNDRTSIQGLGLTYQSEVSKLPDGSYFTEVEAAPLSGRKSGAVSQALKNSVGYCKAQNKNMQEIKNEIGSHYFINGVARLTFCCK